MSFNIKLEGFDELASQLSNSSSIISKNFTTALQNSTDIVRDRARRKVGSSPTVYQGTLAKSISTRVTKLTGIVSTDQVYAKSIEYGRKPGKRPPSDPIEKWARLKLGKSGMGFVIAKKIGQRGTKAQPFFEPALKDSIGDIERYFSNSLDKAIKAIIQ